MSSAAIISVLIAALLHAGWNLVVKDSGDKLIGVWAITIFAAMASAVFLIVVGPPDTAVWPWIGASAVVHICYVTSLAAAYVRADLAVAYPIARGTAPVLAAAGGVFLLGDTLGPVAVAGIAMIVTALAAIALQRTSTGVWWAVLTGVFIAGYTLVDASGVRAGDEAFRYVPATTVMQAVILTPIVLKSGGVERVREAVRGNSIRLAVGGVASVLAYALVMNAARSNPVGLVSALREISTIIAVMLGAVLLKEPVSTRHWIATVVAAGAVVTIGAA